MIEISFVMYSLDLTFCEHALFKSDGIIFIIMNNTMKMTLKLLNKACSQKIMLIKSLKNTAQSLSALRCALA